GLQGVGFLCFLDAAGALSLPLRELVIERAVAARQAPLPLRDLKMILLMACRSVGYRPEALILDELCEDHAGRVVH
ncbi:MAG: DUF494 domain-containing protein, partial [Rhodoferax sp.]|nr:DUF494 domain-containing protein [Rhodoferax sp.]